MKPCVTSRCAVQGLGFRVELRREEATPPPAFWAGSLGLGPATDFRATYFYYYYYYYYYIYDDQDK